MTFQAFRRMGRGPIPIWALALGVLSLSAVPLAARDRGDGNRQLGSGQASYYGHKFIGQRTASGETYQRDAYTAAHRTAPFGSRIKVRHLGNGREVIVRVNDRGPWAKGRIIDLSYAAAQAIGLHRSGTAQVSLAMLED